MQSAVFSQRISSWIRILSERGAEYDMAMIYFVVYIWGCLILFLDGVNVVRLMMLLFCLFSLLIIL